MPSSEPQRPLNMSKPESERALISSFACTSCVRRKVKCDRMLPACSSCVKTKAGCVYRAPPPPQRRRRRLDQNSGGQRKSVVAAAEESDLKARLAQYEQILQEHGLLPDPAPPAVTGENKTSDEARDGRLIFRGGKSRYVSSSVWLDADEAELHDLAEHDNYDENEDANFEIKWSIDPLSAALLGNIRNLVDFHPSPGDAQKLWTAHSNNVEPLCKILHIPTTTKMVEKVTQQPATASKEDECLLFAIYHFATLSMSDEECLRDFGQSRSTLLPRYSFALRQALVNASWLKTTDMTVLQALVLYLLATRLTTDPHTYWIMTGVAVRIAQRMGLHRNREETELPPFEVEMRRRLFWQLIPLDGYAGQISGTSISVPPNSWETKQPLNINDSQIWPGMTKKPVAQEGPTEMIFCLVKAQLSDLYNRSGVKVPKFGPTVNLKTGAELDKIIDEAEGAIEAKYLRYCEIGNPLNFLLLGNVRSAANSVRLRNRISRLVSRTDDASDQEMRDLCALADKILETDNALYRNPSVRGFRWKIESLFIWDALKCLLMGLSRPGFYATADELSAMWNKIAEVYSNHGEITEAKGAMQAIIGKATLQAWDANPPSLHPPVSEPTFITMLHSQYKKIADSKPLEDAADSGNVDGAYDESMFSLDDYFGPSGIMDLNMEDYLNVDPASWTFWDSSQA
ncbi:fungal-specific transcription factor domain-containing protein [Apiospora phragmitis]|uniref:Fungal-specific transcription factor domain-containing protein n=1 Tax=Apiospora phragmitis TaxID=2905665 RepID=A0ABR1VG22_9PEZI